MANERARGLGYKFVTDDKYLVDPFSPTDGISYEGDGSPVSYANSGIMAQAPIIYPPINQGGGGGDDGDDDEIIKKYTGPSVSPLEAAKQAGMFMINPMGFLANRAFKAYRSRQKQKADLDADQTYKAQQEKNFKEMAANPNNRDGKPAAYNYAGRDNDQGTHTSTVSNKKAQENQDKGRGRYFFGGRVNYKAGGRTDAGPNRTTASHSTRGQINESGQQVSGGQTTRDNNDGGNSPFYGPKPTFFNNPEILNKETILGDIPTGIGFDNSYGRYKATMDLEESLKEKGLEGGIEYNNNIGNFDLAAKYNTQDGPSYGAGYTGNNFDVGVNNKTGASANYSKDIFDGRGKITAGGTRNPDGTYNAEGKIIFNYANGGLASIL